MYKRQALDDEFAKDVSEFDTLKDLKADLKKKITAEREETAKRAFEDALMEQVADNITADVPDAMVEAQARQYLDNFKMQLAQQGIQYDQYMKAVSYTHLVAYSVAAVTAEEIDQMDILNARMLAMNRAIGGLSVPPDLCLIDGNRDHGSAVAITAPHLCLVGGDGKSASIAAASRCV